jgi:AraC family transcriptional regulator of adaptative response / methylphosphotriester-DNA alkyltransferase methyltransferase
MQSMNSIHDPKAAVDQALWQAIINNDSSYNGTFYYGVITTGIFCRPSCKSKSPRKENVRIFKSSEDALSAQFRPCKRCRPTGSKLPDEEWVDHAVYLIGQHYAEPLTLTLLADMLHASPYHLHRMFKRIKGITLAEYILQTRIQAAQLQLQESTNSILDVAMSVGFPNASHFSTVFMKKTGMKPSQYRQLLLSQVRKEI